MDNLPLLKAKLVVPEIPDRVLFSGRIKNLNISGYRTVIITAPAGFGKTTAVLLSLRKNRNNMRWYRMEKEDSFLPVFYAHLIEALFGEEDIDATDSTRSLASIGSISEEYSLLNAVICQDAWIRYPDNKRQVYMIFDDFQNVADNPAIVETIEYFISNMPPSLRIIVMARADIGIRTGKLTLNEDILMIDEQDLRFSKEEFAKLTSDIYKVRIDPDDICTMHEYTEGWIAGITMLLHAAGPNLYNLGERLALGNRQDIFRYFMSEAFGKADKDMIKNLASISILRDFTSDDLKAVFNMENATEIISWLEKNNIYIQKVKTGIASYRFHSLFRSALLSVLSELFTPAEITNMNLNAAYHYKGLGDLHSAIRFLIAAGKTDEAISIAASETLRLMDAGDTDRLTSIFQAFPEERIQSDPYLLFLRGASLMSSELDQSYSYLNDALTLALANGDLALQMRAAGLMISICTQKNDHQNIGGIISLLPKFKMMTASKYGRITLLMSAFLKATWSNELGLAKALCKLIDRIGCDEPLRDYINIVSKGTLLHRLGNLPAAGAIVKQILDHPTAMLNDQWRTIGLVLCHSIASLMRDLETSQTIIEELSSIGEKYNSDYAAAYAFRLAGYYKYQTRDILNAVLKMEEAENVFARHNNPVMVCLTRITKYLWESEYDSAGPLAAKAAAELNHIEVLKPGLGYTELCQANTGTLFKEAGSYDEAERLLMKAYETSKNKKARQSMCGTAMQLADLYYRKNEYALEEKYLRIWGKNAAGNGYIYFREMDYSTLVRVCARCIEKNINADYMLRIMAKYFNTDSAARMAKDPAKTAADPRAFIASCSPAFQKVKLINIKLFGSFKMTVDNVEIGEKEWKTRKICGILKYILANPEKTVSRETLAAIFWAESDPKAAYTSLRVALFELKKLLARFGMAFESEDALIAEGKNGFYLCSRNTILTDADRFSSLYKKYKSEKLSLEDMQELLLQMIELYDGDFLEDDSYAEWAVLFRERYRAIFIEVSYKLAELYMAGSKSDQAEALLVRHMNVDPLDEKACSMLMYVYESSGRKNQAASMRRQFEKRFEAEMGLKPEFKYP